MQQWLVAGAVIEGPDGVLLVQNRRRGGRVDWTPPGGVIDAGEDVLTGLGREVLEETGLTVTGWEGPIYEIEARAPGLGWELRVEVYRATEWYGELVLEDPDGIVVHAEYVAHHECGSRMADTQVWVVEPLTDFLADRWSGSRSYGYHVEGERLADLVVTRL